MIKLPYNETAFRDLQKRLNNKTAKVAGFLVSSLFHTEISDRELTLLVNAILRVAERKGFRSYKVTGGETLFEKNFELLRENGHDSYNIERYHFAGKSKPIPKKDTMY